MQLVNSCAFCKSWKHSQSQKMFFTTCHVDIVSEKLHSPLKFSCASLEYDICTKPGWLMLCLLTVASKFSMLIYECLNTENETVITFWSCVILLSTISQKLYRTPFFLATSLLHNTFLRLTSANIGQGKCYSINYIFMFLFCFIYPYS